MGIRAQEPLLDLLRTSDSVTILMGGQLYAQALGDVGDGQAVEVLVALSRARLPNSYVDSPAQVRASAAEALGKVAGRLAEGPERAQAEAALVDLLKDPKVTQARMSGGRPPFPWDSSRMPAPSGH